MKDWSRNDNASDPDQEMLVGNDDTNYVGFWC